MKPVLDPYAYYRSICAQQIFDQIKAARINQDNFTPLYGLDLFCDDGYCSLPIARSWPHGSRVIALSQNRDSLTKLHKAIKEDAFHSKKDRTHPPLNAYLFPRKHAPVRLPFAHEVFDYTWIALPTEALQNPLPTFREAFRTLKPNGQLVLCVADPNPLLLLTAALVQAANKVLPITSKNKNEDREHGKVDGASLAMLIGEQSPLPNSNKWMVALGHSGGCEIMLKKIIVEITPTTSLTHISLFAKYLRKIWLPQLSDGEFDQLLSHGVALPSPIKLGFNLFTCQRNPNFEFTASLL